METESKATEEVPELSGMADSPSEADWGWLAGIVEGEGTVCLRKYKEGSSGSLYGAYIMVVNTDRKIVEKASKLCNGLRIKIQRPAGKPKYPFIRTRKTLFFIRTDDAKKVLEILEKIYPHMTGRKKRIAEVAMEFCRNRVSLMKKEIEYHTKERGLYELYQQVRSVGI